MLPLLFDKICQFWRPFLDTPLYYVLLFFTISDFFSRDLIIMSVSSLSCSFLSSALRLTRCLRENCYSKFLTSLDIWPPLMRVKTRSIYSYRATCNAFCGSFGCGVHTGNPETTNSKVTGELDVDLGCVILWYTSVFSCLLTYFIRDSTRCARIGPPSIWACWTRRRSISQN